MLIAARETHYNALSPANSPDTMRRIRKDQGFAMTRARAITAYAVADAEIHCS